VVVWAEWCYVCCWRLDKTFIRFVLFDACSILRTFGTNKLFVAYISKFDLQNVLVFILMCYILVK